MSFVIVIAQPIPNMDVYVPNPEERNKEQRVSDILDLFDKQIEDLEAAGKTDAALLARQQKQQYYEDYKKPFVELRGGERVKQLKEDILFPKFDEINELANNINPENARRLVAEMYEDLGDPNINVYYLGGGILPNLEQISHQDIDPETRHIIVDGLRQYCQQAIEQEAIPFPWYARRLALNLYNISTPDDDEALAISRSMFSYALKRARDIGYYDQEQEIIETIQGTLDFDDAMLLLSPEMTEKLTANINPNDIKEARADFRKAIRNPASVALAEKVLAHIKRDWGDDNLRNEMARAYLRYGVLFNRFAANPPPDVKPEQIHKCTKCLNDGMITLTRSNLSQASWNSWRTLAIRMRNNASPELVRTISNRLAEVSADPAQHYAARSLRTALTVLERR
jgi:hypothetical protein